MSYNNIIFDLDGTLWDSSENVAAAWTASLRELAHPALKGMQITQQDMHRIMGKAMDEIADILFPMLSPDERMEVLGKCMEDENRFIAKHGGRIFDGVYEALKELSQEYDLFIVSNCQKGYIEAFLEYSGYGELFMDILCWGDTHQPKDRSIRALMERNDCTNAVYVGDTEGDCIASLNAGIPFIHAAYGFGTLTSPEKATAVINDISQLIEIMKDFNK